MQGRSRREGTSASQGPRPSYAHEVLVVEPSRKIKHEVYRDTHYDAIWWLGNSGFLVRLKGTYIFLDPMLAAPNADYVADRKAMREAGRHLGYEQEWRFFDNFDNIEQEIHELPLPAEDVEQADYVFLSHDDGDHLDPESIKRISHLRPTVVAPRSCDDHLLAAGIPQDSIAHAKYGSTLDFDHFSVEVQYAEHLKSDKVTPAEAVGFLLRTEHGNIYHLGDCTFDHAEKATICNLDVDYLLMPINDTNLGVGFAALLTHLLQPRVVIPCHYGYVYPAIRFQGGHPAEFVTAIAARNYKLPGTDIMILCPGGKVVLV